MSRHAPSAQFSISEADFAREPVLQRRQQPRAHADHADESIRFRTRSKSKSRARESSLRRLPSVQGQEFFALGRSDRPPASSTSRHHSSSSNGRSRDHRDDRSPSASRGRKRERSPPASSSSRAMRTRSKSAARRTLDATADAKPASRRSKSTSRKQQPSSSRSRSRSPDRSRAASAKRKRSKSKSVPRAADKATDGRGSSSHRKRRASSSRSRSPPPKHSSADRELQREIERDEKKLAQAKSALAELEEQLAALQQRVDAKKYEVLDLQIVVDGLHKRRALQQEFLRRDSYTSTSKSKSREIPTERSKRAASPEPEQLSRRGSAPPKRKSKRPVIEDDEVEEDDDDEVEILETPPVRVKKEDKRERSKSTKAEPAPPPPPPAVVVDQMSDYFWGRVDIAKLLVQPRIRNIPDASARKGRHLAFNPVQQDHFAVASDDGGLIIWHYARQSQQVSKVVSIDPASFRKDAPCAESMAWSPDGYRLALAFRDPLASMGEFCVVRLHELALTDGNAPQMLPRDRVKSKTTTLHARGISVIDWVPGGYGDRHGTRGIVTAGSDHAVVLWEEHKGQADYKWRVLHRDHRSDVRTICMHSQGNALYTGALDGTVMRYDLNSQRTARILERRRPHISKINAVLENPHNPNLLLVSCVEPSEHNLVLHDLREKYDHARQSAMTLSSLRASDAKSMSQYIVPRWSPGGFHVSCGSTSGLVNIWDVRVRGPKYPLVLPQQSIAVHQKQVLHATWHPRYDAMFSVSHDRTLGLLTFR